MVCFGPCASSSQKTLSYFHFSSYAEYLHSLNGETGVRLTRFPALAKLALPSFRLQESLPV